MRFLVDENVHLGVVDFLLSLGHDAERVPSGIRNGKVIALAVKKDRILMTHDKDFQDEVRYPTVGTAGIICLRIHPPRLPALTESLRRLFSERTPESLRGRTTSLTR
ncbi:MAG: hypothetical protein FD126_727 [Elusimicrobia bacterium]|nr:MAG: hypothetical protein FD126_727 [Elusimicrobiota bacterium]